MNRYTPDSYAARTEYPDAFSASTREGRFDDQPSPSGSEDDGSYPAFPDTQRVELDVEGDINASLTSQTLNTDGTPKRPMNAFMIFARRRRPQVSAENQSMRTGEISKILSKEWNAMAMSDKQFYLDRAKELKDNFNAKYPDYVYRRRPNNSRKRRRTDNGLGIPLDQPTMGDSADGYATSPDYGDISPVDPVDTDDPTTNVNGQENRYMSVAPGVPGHYDASIVPSQSRQSQPAYRPAESPSYGALGTTESRAPYFSNSHRRATPDATMMPFVPSASSRGLDSGIQAQVPLSQYSAYMQNASRTQTPSYFAESNHAHSHTPPDLWQAASAGSRDDHARGSHPHPAWVPSGQDSSSTRSDERHHAYGAQPAQQQHSWVAASPSDSMSSRSTSGAHTPNYSFPTLNSPFYPGQSHLSDSYQQQGPIQSLPSPSSPYGVMEQTPGGTVSGRHSGAFGDGRSYTAASTMHASSAYPANNQDVHVHAYHQQSHNAPLSIHLPSMPSYSHAQSTSPSSPADSSASASHLRYWTREKVDN
ncbi:hypothetical protein BJ138DRAFT_1116113 [Hygrophoropsis aurantiaca]|uniref:Uncharacterized protein n=1 Tax=Hygrophoropsis aurantiaca TaxID=72124 RepID=A0ACB8A3T1_9AGAM|nr:hypothetical protein BJ138DRAFT_1116113 [Hygrophoropsis aurantiaca]